MVNYLILIFHDLKRWIAGEKNKGISYNRVLFYHLPLKIISKSYSLVAALINDYFINNIINYKKFKTFQKLNSNKLGNHFYIIVMPNILHYLMPCIKLIPNNINFILVLNGINKWEEIYLRDNYKEVQIFKLITIPHSSLSHGSVLNLLLANNKLNFGILDHDLYIFNQDIFEKLTFNKDNFIIGVFRLTNNKSMLTFPTTHFLFFNVNLIQQIMCKSLLSGRNYMR